ncbi:hypothetical protein [Alkalicoccobacillus porphyridii]|nr:hypothetical protein [Alkalicoccobacillus porphyridii]
MELKHLPDSIIKQAYIDACEKGTDKELIEKLYKEINKRKIESEI